MDHSQINFFDRIDYEKKDRDLYLRGAGISHQTY